MTTQPETPAPPGGDAPARPSGRPVGFIGLGRMGLSLARSLTRKGFAPLVNDLAPGPMQSLAAEGAAPVADAGALAARCGIVFLMLTGPAEVRAVALTPGGVFDRAAPGTVIVDLSTVDVATADLLAAEAAARGLRFADAPVGRLAAHADRGESLFMLGADDDLVPLLAPCLGAMGTTTLHCGPAGHGTRMKLVNNFMVLSYCQINSEALVLTRALGLDLPRALEVLLGTTAVNGQLRDKWPVKVLAGDLSPGFAMALALKDLTLACEAAARGGVAVPMGNTARDMFRLAITAGHGGKDTSALTDFWAQANGIAPLRLDADAPQAAAT